MDDLLVGHKDVTITYEQPYEAPFNDAEFYYHGTVAVVEARGRKVYVESVGDRDISILSEDGEHVEKRLQDPGDFMRHCPDGELPVDGEGCVWDNNGWFELATEDDYVGGYEPAFDYYEAVQSAIDLVMDDEYWNG